MKPDGTGVHPFTNQLLDVMMMKLDLYEVLYRQIGRIVEQGELPGLWQAPSVGQSDPRARVNGV